MEQILLIVSMGEVSECYLLPKEEVSEEALQVLQAMAGKYGGANEFSDSEDEKLSLMLCSPDSCGSLTSPELTRFVGMFWEYKVEDSSSFQAENVTLVINSGFAI